MNETKLFVIFVQAQMTLLVKFYVDGMDSSSMTLHLQHTHPNLDVLRDTMYQLHESSVVEWHLQNLSERCCDPIHLYESTKKHHREEAMLHPFNHIHLGRT